MNCRVDPAPAVQTNFSVNTLDEATRTTDDTINWQSNTFSIRKYTFNPVVNFKSGLAYWALGFTRLRMYTLVQAKGAKYSWLSDISSLQF